MPGPAERVVYYGRIPDQSRGRSGKKARYLPTDVTDILEVRFAGKALHASFYATDFKLRDYPEIKSLRTFSRIVDQIRSETKE